MSEYTKQAEKFLKETSTGFKTQFLKNGVHFDDDVKRDIYVITLTRGTRVYNFEFGQSINSSVKFKIFTKEGIIETNDLKRKTKEYQKGNRNIETNKEFKEPSCYDVLASLTSYDPDSFKEFCSSYGYDEDSIKAKKTYNAVVEEWKNVQIIWSNEEIEKLQEIN